MIKEMGQSWTTPPAGASYGSPSLKQHSGAGGSSPDHHCSPQPPVGDNSAPRHGLVFPLTDNGQVHPLLGATATTVDKMLAAQTLSVSGIVNMAGCAKKLDTLNQLNAFHLGLID